MVYQPCSIVHALRCWCQIHAHICCFTGVAQHAELALHVLQVLLAATSNQEARAAVHGHAAGMSAVLLLATSSPTPAWSHMSDNPAQGSAAPAAACSAAAAADLLVQIAEEKQIKPLLAQPLAQVRVGCCCLM
jgi:hypothetical protein